MVVLEKVTLDYSEPEDRLKMSAQVAQGGEPMVFWLTQRFCRRLAQALCKHCERDGVEQSLLGQELQQACRQREAEWEHKASEPVMAVAASEATLLETVDLSFAPEQVRLQIPLAEGAAVLPLSIKELRQWLSILYRMFKRAEWPMDCWPAWLRNEGGAWN